MLRKFRVKNFLSFRDWQTLDLTVAANAPDLPGRFVQSVPGSKDRFPTFVAIFGANASGKTNILRALTFLLRFIRSSHRNPPDAPIPLLAFQGHSSDHEAIEFDVEIDAALGEAEQRQIFRYRLTISPDRNRVLKEELRYYPGPRSRRLFLRTENGIVFGDDFRIRRNDPSIDKIRSNCSAISILAQFDHRFSLDVLNGLSGIRTNVSDLYGSQDIPMDRATKYYRENPAILDKFVDLSRKFDIGIESIDIVPLDNGLQPVFYHRGIEKPLLSTVESHGTKKIFSLFPILELVLEDGGIAIVDELDNEVHSLLLPEIVDLFVDRNLNRDSRQYCAQMIAVCHNPSMLENLEKEEIFFTEKKPDGATSIYGLKDIGGVRRETNLYANYLAGAFGGVPMLG